MSNFKVLYILFAVFVFAHMLGTMWLTSNHSKQIRIVNNKIETLNTCMLLFPDGNMDTVTSCARAQFTLVQ